MSDQLAATPTRPNYFYGQFLQAEDFQAEQIYHAGQLQQLARVVRQPGILVGLDVTVTDAQLGRVLVKAGLAIDGQGHLLVLEADTPFDFPSDADGAQVLTLSYNTVPDRPAPGGGSQQFTRTIEQPMISAAPLPGPPADTHLRLAQFKLDKGKIVAFGTDAAALVDQGVRTSAGAAIAGDLVVGGPTRLDAALAVGGSATINQALTVQGQANLAQQLTVGGAASFGQTLTVQGQANLAQALSVGGPTTLSQALTVKGDSRLGAALTVSGPTTLSQGLAVAGNVAIGLATGPRSLFVQGSEVHSGGKGAGFSFNNRETADFSNDPTSGDRWVWYASGKTARLWSAGDKLAITADGNIGINRSDPKRQLHISGNGPLLALEGTSHGYVEWYPKGYANGRKAYLGFGDASYNLMIAAETAGANVQLLTNNGHVVVGTAQARTSVQVFGNLSLGINGDLTASGGPEAIRILRGRFYLANGWNQNGAGFFLQPIGNGINDIVFNPPFADIPAVVVAQEYGDFAANVNTLDNCTVIAVDKTRCRVKCGNSDGVGTNRNFHFIAMGPQ